MDIEWDKEKAASNIRKHQVSFDEAATVLLDPATMGMEDYLARNERRWILIGMSVQGRLLTVIYTLPDESRIRLISARRATRNEATYYA